MEISKVVGLCLAGKVDNEQDFIDAATFLGAKAGNVEIFTGGIKDIHSCVLADVDDELFLAIRATAGAEELETNIEFDWLNNFLGIQEDLEGVPGLVHTGFKKGAEILWDSGLGESLAKRLEPGKVLNCNGYSKGGGIAPILTSLVEFRLAHTPSLIDTYLFAPPRCGNKVFTDEFNSKFSQTFRYEYQDDLVPHMAPKDEFMDILVENSKLFQVLDEYTKLGSWEYTHVGSLKFIDWEENLINDYDGLAEKRLQKIKEVIGDGNYAKFAADHSVPTNMYPILTGGLELPPTIADLYS